MEKALPVHCSRLARSLLGHWYRLTPPAPFVVLQGEHDQSQANRKRADPANCSISSTQKAPTVQDKPARLLALPRLFLVLVFSSFSSHPSEPREIETMATFMFSTQKANRNSVLNKLTLFTSAGLQTQRGGGFSSPSSSHLITFRCAFA